ncbi:MAG: trimethylamine methyltransferase family protein [Deltaproteobacteria bacterium]|jgi:trimethylamine--corrinoid protein Co-methyltransferase|nr:trimethylamine methyltransferase family protein [Deltaproteobacteria bacterium]
MLNRLIEYGPDELAKIHRATVRILSEAGVSFPGGPALKVFKEHGFKTDGDRVFMGEDELRKALSTVPRTVPLVARNPEKTLVLGQGPPILLGTTGPPKMLLADGTFRPGTLADYEDTQKLSQNSPLIQTAAYKAIYPQDIPPKTAHLEMLLRTLTLTDLFAGGDSQEEVNTRDTLNMVGLVFGGTDFLLKNTVVRITVSVLSPLRYAPEQSASLIMLAENNQLAVVSNMAMLGSTSPVDLPASLALGNAEILAGIVLSQLVRPGAPVVYGSTSCPVDMKGMAATLGSPETLRVSHAAVSLARSYAIPSRTGGGLNDGFALDGQASAEAALVLQMAIASGADFIMHAFGMMGGYIAASLEKWILDEELASFILDSLKPFTVSGEIDVGEVIKLGPGANYLIQPSTMKRFREFHQFKVFNKLPMDLWRKKGGLSLIQACEKEVKRRLSVYERPPMDPKLEAELVKYVQKRKEEIF